MKVQNFKNIKGIYVIYNDSTISDDDKYKKMVAFIA